MIFHRLVIEFTTKLRNARFHGGDLAECEDHLVRNVSLYIYMLAARFVFYLEQLYEYCLLAAWRLCQQCSIETRDSVHKEMLSGCILFAIM